MLLLACLYAIGAAKFFITMFQQKTAKSLQGLTNWFCSVKLLLQNIQNEWARVTLTDIQNLTEGKIDEILHKFLQDFKENSLKPRGWPVFLSANVMSKAAMNAFTRLLSRKYPSICINCVCPGSVSTDINYNSGLLNVEEGAKSPVRLALLPDGRLSGLFFIRQEESPFW